MAFVTPITIEETIKNIESKKYLLPDIQRDIVWGTEEIELLFDSLMRDYPIGSLLFWELSKEHIKDHLKDYKFYEFIREYSELNSKRNPRVNIDGLQDIVSVLDGQQRLTALYIGLKGSYAYKTPRKRYDSPEAYPIRKLYLNLKNDLSKQEDSNRGYDFRFLTEDEAKQNDKEAYWFEVGKVLEFAEEFQVNDYLVKNNLLNSDDVEKNLFANRTLFRLYATIRNNTVINYYLEKSNELDKVLNIFIRVNNGGTKLNYTDLLLSMATCQWEERDVKEEITKFVNEINLVGDGFKFDKDFILRACLVLTDVNNINFKIDNFKKETMLLIEKNWDNITQSIRSAVYLVSSFGYNRETLTSNNSIIPIAYYLLKNGLPNKFESSTKYKDDRKLINKWIIISLLKKVFSAHPENLYRGIREIINENLSEKRFPLDRIVEKFRGAEKSIVFNTDDIENLFTYKYSQTYTFSALSILYSNLDYRNKFHIDHIFPKSHFTKKKLMEKGVDLSDIEFCLENYNSLANLQLIEGIVNQEKSDSDFKRWLYETYPNESERKDYMRKNYIPDNIDLDITNFKEFIIERHKLMSNAYKKIM